MAQTKLNMLLQLRRDNVFTSTYVLQAGEPGFEISTGTLKIGDGTKTWAQLDIANKEAIDALIKVVDDKVKALGDTYATDEELANGLALKADLATYNAYVAAHANDYTNAQVDAEIKKVDDKFASYRTSADQDVVDNAIKGRLDALELIDHDHANKAELDLIASGDKAKWDTAAGKAHTHSFNETELNKIAEGDVAKWNAVVADHLDAEDYTTLENSIKDAKKAGTDANTNIETYKVANDARVKAVEDDIAEIVDGTNGILAQAKADAANKVAAAKTEISAEIDADVKVVADDLAEYVAANDTALAGVKATAEAAATKVYADAELAKKVDKVDGYSLVSNVEIERLSKVDNYNDTEVRGLVGDNAKAIEDLEGYVGTFTHATAKTVVDYINAKTDGIATSGNLEALGTRVTAAEGKITALEEASATHATKTELNNVDAKFDSYNTKAAQKLIDDAQDARIKAIEDDYLVADDIKDFETKANVKKVADDLAAYVEANDAAVADRYTKTEADNKFAIKGADAYDDAEVRGLISDNADAIAAEAERAAGIEAGLRTDVDVVKADYLKAADKTELDGKITAEETRAKGVEESLQTQINTIMSNPDAEGAINSINEFTQYVKDHGTIADGMRTDINKNKDDIAAEVTRATGAESALSGRIDVLEAIDYDAYLDADAALETKLNGAIEDAKTDASNKDAVVLSEAQKYADQAEADAIAAAASALATAKTELEGKITAVNTGVMTVEAGNDIVVTPGENGKVTVAHETFTTGAYTKDPASSDKTGDVYMMTSVTVDNGHVTGANVQSLASALEGMLFIFDGGSSSDN